MMKMVFHGVVLILVTTSNAFAADRSEIRADLLVVGGTESGWVAAIQAARMGVNQIVLVNDIEWLGGQFTAEALVAIDENRSEEETRRRSVKRLPSIPRSGLFKELADRIEQFNREKYGHPSPGNTIVGTTCRPAEAQAIFQQMIRPYVDRGQIRMITNHVPVTTQLSDDRNTLRAVRFRSTKASADELTVAAKVTIDASDWGDVIQLSHADFDFGPDLKSQYGEPLAPERREGYPLTDMNPISYCMVLEETDSENVIPRPTMYDERRYFNTTRLTKKEHQALPWPHRPIEAFSTVAELYRSRRIVDHVGLKNVKGPDLLLLCWFVQDYPLDVLPKHVVEALENTEKGASKKNIVVMTPQQRQIVFNDARQHSLGMLHHLQTTVHDRQRDDSHSFRRFRLSDEFRNVEADTR
ncbi:MAG: FAD-dependent oxidoreductase [Pirellulaceae bacterium]